MFEEFKPPPNILASEKIVVGKKVFFLDLKENPRGRFLQITEDVGGRRDRVMIPAEALGEFGVTLFRLINTSEQMPPAQGE